MKYCILVFCLCLGALDLSARADVGVSSSNVSPTVTFPADQIQLLVKQTIDRELPQAVRSEVTEQEDLRFTQMKWFLAIVGLIGLGTFGTLANYLIEKAVESRIEKRTNNIAQAIAFSRFYAIALKLEISQSFSQPDVDAVMNYLRKVEKNSEIRHSTEFLAALRQIAKSFASAGQSASIDELFMMYEREILSAPHLVEPLLHHYGQEIVAPEIPSNEDFGYEVFQKLERVSSSSQLPELALAYRTLYESASRRPEEQAIVVRLIQRSTHLNDRDRARYLREMLLRSRAQNWVSIATPESSRIEAVVRSLFASRADTFENAYGLERSISERIAAQGIDNDEAARITARMASHITR